MQCAISLHEFLLETKKILISHNKVQVWQNFTFENQLSKFAFPLPLMKNTIQSR